MKEEKLDKCYGFVCFIPLDGGGQRIFGFPEFLAGLALMVLAWTIADVRYRFRVATAPVPLQAATFTVVVVLGVLTLLTDLWREEQWLVPAGRLLTPGSWQALLGGVFLLTFLTWAWYALLRPPTFGRMNAVRFVKTLQRYLLEGSPETLSVIASELQYSVKSIVRYSSGVAAPAGKAGRNARALSAMPNVELCANRLLLLIAERRLCRAIVGSAPITAATLFVEIGVAEKFGRHIGTFGRNVFSEAIWNRDSFLFHEDAAYDSGLLGKERPISNALFSNYRLVEGIQTMFDQDYWRRKWDADQWEAYCRAVLLTFRNYVMEGVTEHSYVLFRSIGDIEHSVDDIYTLNGISDRDTDGDALARMRVAIDFVVKAAAILDEKGIPDHLQLRIRGDVGRVAHSMLDHLAHLIFKLVFAASTVSSPRWECWSLQHNMVWSELFGRHVMMSAAARVIQFKARRLLYEEIREMDRFANFSGARVIRFCLNVLGLTVIENRLGRNRALQRVVLNWIVKNFARLHMQNPRLAEACLVEGITFDIENCRLVRTYPVEGLRVKPKFEYLYLDAAPVPPDDSVN